MLTKIKMEKLITGKNRKSFKLKLMFFPSSEFGTMINPKVYKPPPKFSFRNLKKYMPQIKEMARREGIAREKEKEGKRPVGTDTVLRFLKDD